jgi:hypothetical protein
LFFSAQRHNCANALSDCSRKTRRLSVLYQDVPELLQMLSTCSWDPPPATVVIDSDPGYLAAFAGTCPAMTDATFILISLNGGTEHLVTYAKSLLWFVPPGGSMWAA